MTRQPLHGIIAAVATPLKKNLRPDYDLFISHCRHLLDAGCHGLGILGSTGEANSIHLDDRIKLIERAAEFLPKETLLVGTGSCAIAEAVQLSRCAAENGIKNLLVLPPFYYTPVTDTGIRRYYDLLIEGINDPEVCIFLYNFPKLTGYRFTSAVINDLIDRHGDTIAGLKDSSGDLEGMMDYLTISPSFRVFSGTEEYLLDMIQAGGAGCISATINITSSMARAVWDSHAPHLQNHLTELRTAIQAHPLVPAVKAILASQSGIPAWRTMAPPYVPLEGETERQLLDTLGELQRKDPRS
ncbi:dihydrodipicolinate synthase family protein [Emcibacter nanhaiensis]|uniref:Dihydrodipicolinate synthase family protein n=1 Tax=Emcibacter nanhaiensis TaxID=1505037 RepID=A0A501PFP5_9PROT|nr:dihydrodipicolinate synthase family protein [Emcibacter nanhaiensis]TPD59289.1 dihydrodipicolinate synthase family protein [Emcibacter nanhaiensis]